MSEGRVIRIVTVHHAQGLHARPAELVAREAMRYTASVEIVRDSLRVDAKSILNLLTLGATQGVSLSVEADGADAAEAVEALARLIEGEFPEDDANEQASPGGASGTTTN